VRKIVYLLVLIAPSALAQIDSVGFEPGTAFTLRKLYFDAGKATINTKDHDPDSTFLELNKLVEVLQARPAMHIVIIGHTDNKGSPIRNMRLSVNRAWTVKGYLVDRGVSSQQITIEGKGGSEAVTEGNSPLNRRIEIYITGE
jgi:OmpA-OmpF porin, OOP family